MAGEIYDWSVTAADNATSDATVNWAEGQLPSTVNNSARAMMASVASLVKDIGGTVTTGGSANAHTFTSNVDVTALATGQMFVAKAGFTNTAAATMNFSCTSAKAIKKYTSAGEADLSAGDIRASGIYHFVYDAAANAAAGAWMLLNPTGHLGAGSVITIPDGLVGTPGLAFTADLDNGAYRSATNTWHLVAGAQTALTLTSLALSTAVDFIVNTTGTFEIDVASGNTYGVGTLRYDGVATFGSNILVSGNAVLNGTITVSEAAAFDNTIGVSGAGSFGDGITAVGPILSSSATAPLGYTTGAGGTVTQATGKGTTVTLNKVCGEIALSSASLDADTTVSFALQNTAISATDVMIINHVSGGTLGNYLLNVNCQASGATIYVRNISTGALAQPLTLRYAVVNAVTS
jgi:hypothetical protein